MSVDLVTDAHGNPSITRVDKDATPEYRQEYTEYASQYIKVRRPIVSLLDPVHPLGQANGCCRRRPSMSTRRASSARFGLEKTPAACGVR